MNRHIYNWPLTWILVLLLTGMVATMAGAAELDRMTLELKVGGSDMVNTKYPFKRVSIANPEVADLVVISPRALYVYGKKAGYTSVILWEEGNGQTLLDVVISLDLTGLKKRIYELYPAQQIEVHSSETGVVLSGTVSGPEIVDQVLRLTRTFLPKLAEGDDDSGGTGRSGSGITNLLQVSGIHQVMLEVKVAEVNRSKGKDWQAGLGLNDISKNVTGAMSSNSSVLTSLQFDEAHPGPAMLVDGTIGSLIDGTIDGITQNPGTMLFNFAGNAANIFLNIDDFSAALNLMETEGLAKTLAEPHLVTQSGQEASFLAGGEFPIPVPDKDGNITIDYKDFGVSLVFTPVVLSNGSISLRVAPSVSEIISTQTLSSSADTEYVVPYLSTRRLQTTVQLQDGQTLALAGLLQDNFNDTVNKIPGLGDLPILGALFRSTGFSQEKTELMIAVTPHLVKPVPAGSLKMPGDDLKPPGWYEFYLEGRLEGIRTPTHRISAEPVASESNSADGGLEGVFGYQPVTGQ